MFHRTFRTVKINIIMNSEREENLRYSLLMRNDYFTEIIMNNVISVSRTLQSIEKEVINCMKLNYIILSTVRNTALRSGLSAKKSLRKNTSFQNENDNEGHTVQMEKKFPMESRNYGYDDIGESFGGIGTPPCGQPLSQLRKP